MKILKYAVLAILICSIYKKTIYTTHEPLKAAPPAGSSLKHYNAKKHMATMTNGDVYVGIVEYSQPVTPPNLAIPALESFATIKNPNYKQQPKGYTGGQSPNTQLFGIPVTGTSTPLKNSAGKTIGKYWADSKIAQLTNGDVYVMIITHAASQASTGAHAVGPVWTWYQQSSYQADFKKYGVNSSAQSLQQNINTDGIGTVMISNQKYTVYGIGLSSNSSDSISNETTSGSSSSTTTSTAPQTFMVNTASLPKTTMGTYDPKTKTATIKFTGVMVRSQATTPPNVNNPKMVQFGTMPNTKTSTAVGGGQSRTATLWGIPTTSTAMKTKKPKTTSTAA